MSESVSQNKNRIENGDIVAGDKVTNIFNKDTKLSRLFSKLQEAFEEDKKIQRISSDLNRFHTGRDTIGLEQKLVDGNFNYLLDDAEWLKEEYVKKLTKYQFFEPAQEIHSFLLGVVFEKFRNCVYPCILEGRSQAEISKCISDDVIQPILNIIREEGCDDIMGLGAVDIEGMIYFLTGKCFLKWN